jgi:hypothetical protein
MYWKIIVRCSALTLAGIIMLAASVGTGITYTNAQTAQAATIGGIPATHLPLIHYSPDYQIKSSNWSGYADIACTTCKLRYVQTSFTLPSLNCTASSPESWVSMWAGLDGWNDNTVEQTGITIECVNGATQYVPWYQMDPNQPVAYTVGSVHAGDQITASVYYDAGKAQYQMVLVDVTTGKTLSTSQKCPVKNVCDNASAEVIAESPYSDGLLPLADFGAVDFMSCTVTSWNGTRGTLTNSGLWSPVSIVMSGSSGNVLASPGLLQGGSAFADTWHAGS